MTVKLKSLLERKIQNSIHREINEIKPVGGGDIAESYHVTLSDNRSIFVKTTSSSSTMFHNEASGLREIKKTGAIKVPEVLFVDDQLLALEMIESSHSRSNSFFSLFGKQMAKLHRNSSKSWGYFEDNYIGKTKQKNLPQLPYDSNMSSGGWFEFYFKNRLMVQYRLMERNGFCTKEVSSLFSRLENNLETILSYAKEPPALLHGDLWGGNYLIGKGGTPYLIDPAIYYGHREADLAMTSLFGGFNPIFYEAYNKEYPLQSGYKKREPLYQLYHLMNHLNMFGSSYYSQVISVLRLYQ